MAAYLPELIGGKPPLGFLVSMQIRHGEASMSDYQQKVDELEARGYLSVVQAGQLSTKKRRAWHAFLSAVQRFGSERDLSQTSVRWLVRLGKGRSRDSNTPRFLVREEIKVGANGSPSPEYTELARIEWDVTNKAMLIYMTQSGLDNKQETDSQINRLRELFIKESQCFHTRVFALKASRLLDDMLPLIYGPNKQWRFLKFQHRRLIMAFDELADLLDKLSGNASRGRISSVCTFPVPDIPEMKIAMRGAYDDELRNMLVDCEDAIKDYEDNIEDGATLYEALQKINTTIGKTKEYKEWASQEAGKATSSLKELQLKTAAMLGLDTLKGKPSRNKWGNNAPALQRRFVEILGKYAKDSVYFIRDAQVILWVKGFGHGALEVLCQDQLEETTQVRVQFLRPPTNE